MVAIDDVVRVSILHWNEPKLETALLRVTEIPRPHNAPPLNKYLVEPHNDPVHDFDYTAFVPSQAYLTANNLPFVMSMLSPPGPPSAGPVSVAREVDIYDVWGRKMRLYPGLLPDRISYKVEGWRIAFWLKLGKLWNMDIQDIAARIHPRLFNKNMPCELWCEKPHLMKMALHLRAKRYEQSVGAPNFKNKAFAERMHERIDRLSERQISVNTAWPVYVNEGITYTRQPANEWRCAFESPPHGPTPPVLAEIRKVKELIRQKKTLYNQQLEEPGQDGHASPAKEWWQVKLPGPAQQSETDHATAPETDDVDPGHMRDATDLEMADAGPATLTTTEFHASQMRCTTDSEMAGEASATLNTEYDFANQMIGTTDWEVAGAASATPNGVTMLPSNVIGDFDWMQPEVMTDEERADEDFAAFLLATEYADLVQTRDTINPETADEVFATSNDTSVLPSSVMSDIDWMQADFIFNQELPGEVPVPFWLDTEYDDPGQMGGTTDLEMAAEASAPIQLYTEDNYPGQMRAMNDSGMAAEASGTPTTASVVPSSVLGEIDWKQHGCTTDEEIAELDKLMGYEPSVGDTF